MIGPDNQARILDFGIGSLLVENEGESLVDTMSTANTLTSGLDCASPESIMEPTNRTPAGDQYSLGCVLYFCLTGRVPFPEGSAVEKMMAHQTKEPMPITELAPDVPDGLIAIVEEADGEEARRSLRGLRYDRRVAGTVYRQSRRDPGRRAQRESRDGRNQQLEQSHARSRFAGGDARRGLEGADGRSSPEGTSRYADSAAGQSFSFFTLRRAANSGANQAACFGRTPGSQSHAAADSWPARRVPAETCGVERRTVPRWWSKFNFPSRGAAAGALAGREGCFSFGRTTSAGKRGDRKCPARGEERCGLSGLGGRGGCTGQEAHQPDCCDRRGADPDDHRVYRRDDSAQPVIVCHFEAVPYGG